MCHLLIESYLVAIHDIYKTQSTVFLTSVMTTHSSSSGGPAIRSGHALLLRQWGLWSARLLHRCRCSLIEGWSTRQFHYTRWWKCVRCSANVWWLACVCKQRKLLFLLSSADWQYRSKVILIGRHRGFACDTLLSTVSTSDIWSSSGKNNSHLLGSELVFIFDSWVPYAEP